MRRNVFTIIAKDNIDLNARSTKVKDHFHGISMTQMQFLSKDVLGDVQQPLYNLKKMMESDQDSSTPKKITAQNKLKLPDDYTAFKEMSSNKTFFSPVCTINIEYVSFPSVEFDRGKTKEISWLQQVESSKVETCEAWSTFHSKSISNDESIKELL